MYVLLTHRNPFEKVVYQLILYLLIHFFNLLDAILMG